VDSAAHHRVTDGACSTYASLQKVLCIERDALDHVIAHLPATAATLVEWIHAVKGRLVMTGMGKSGYVARKCAATCASLGIPSFFLHPAESIHGDLGMVMPEDFVIIFSKSGTGPEFEMMMPYFRSRGNRIALICCTPGSISRLVDITVVLPIQKEACSLGVAPTSSSTVMVAFGDALAITASTLRGFSHQQFAQVHPAGNLGKQLLLTVGSVMYTHPHLPLVAPATSVTDVIGIISAKNFGVGIVADHHHYLLGVITDGDLRRACSMGPAMFTATAGDIMTHSPKTVGPDMLAYDALCVMEDFNITSLVVVDNQKVKGFVHIHDIVKAGIQRSAR
jgi:arabinose-5-phosphate isomerase